MALPRPLTPLTEEGWQERVRDIHADGATWWWIYPIEKGKDSILLSSKFLFHFKMLSFSSYPDLTLTLLTCQIAFWCAKANCSRIKRTFPFLLFYLLHDSKMILGLFSLLELTSWPHCQLKSLLGPSKGIIK